MPRIAESFLLVNPAMRHWVDVGLGEFSSKAHGRPTCVASRALLLMAGRSGFLHDAPLAGVWERDTILFVGDEGTFPTAPDLPATAEPSWYWEAKDRSRNVFRG